MLCGNLYKLDLVNVLDVSSSSSFLNVVDSKRLRCNENYSMLWHKRLGHISRQRMERFVKDDILQDLDFSDFDTYADCIK